MMRLSGNGANIREGSNFIQLIGRLKMIITPQLTLSGNMPLLFLV